MADEELVLQREVQQVVGQAVVAKAHAAFGRFVVDDRLGRVPRPGCLEAGADLGVREADDRRLVEVVENLAVEPVAVDRDAGEIALVEERLDGSRHEVLGGFQREKDRRAGRVGEAGRFCDEGPVEVDHPPGQAAHRQDGDLTAGRRRRASQPFRVRLAKRALGQQHQDVRAGYPGPQQVRETGDRGGGFPSAGRTFEEDAPRSGGRPATVDWAGVSTGSGERRVM